MQWEKGCWADGSFFVEKKVKEGLTFYAQKG
jgi:hypothetical protein